MAIAAFSGVDQITPQDQTNGDAASSSTTTPSGGTLTPKINGSLLISVMGFNNANYTSVNSGFSTTDTHNNDASSAAIAFAYLIQSVAANVTPTFTKSVSNSQWAITNITLVPTGVNNPGLISHTLAQSTNGNNVTTGAINTTNASVLFVLAAVDSTSSEVITDSASNTWTARTDFGAGTNHVRLFYCINPTTSASHTFTCTIASGKPSIAVAAFSNVSSYDTEVGAGQNTPWKSHAGQ